MSNVCDHGVSAEDNCAQCDLAGTGERVITPPAVEEAAKSDLETFETELTQLVVKYAKLARAEIGDAFSKIFRNI